MSLGETYADFWETCADFRPTDVSLGETYVDFREVDMRLGETYMDFRETCMDFRAACINFRPIDTKSWGTALVPDMGFPNAVFLTGLNGKINGIFYVNLANPVNLVQ